ncbi:unnamed protein product, partial [Meganyctiphanes norvegica]
EVNYQILNLNGSEQEILYISNDHGTLEIMHNLDREHQEIYNFLIIASDKGSPPLSTYTYLTMTVFDINDNAPVIESQNQHCTLIEEAAETQFVSQVVAWDFDSSFTQNLYYSIIDGNVKNTFEINPSSGLIRVANPKKIFTKSLYNLNISVSDGVFTTYTSLSISITPLNR